MPVPIPPIAAARVMASVVDLTPSLSSHFATIYALAILFPSLVILLAGSFLTLDRTRSVDDSAASYAKSLPVVIGQYGPPKEKSKFNPWQFRGGLGGMLSGFLLGLHLAALVALALANRVNGAPLSSAVFLLIWLVFGLVLGTVGGRWSTSAALIIAVLGGASTALFLSASFHPSLPARLILLALLVLVALCGTFLPVLKSRHLHRWTLRASSASSGSLGIIVSISILSGVKGWASAWLRFVVKDAGQVWMSSKEKGLCFVFVLLALLGVGSDWWIERKWGVDEGPIPRWQDYLAQFQPDKSGPSSQPWSAPFFSSSGPNKLYSPTPPSSKSIWSRIFSRRQERAPRLPGSFDSFESEDVGEFDPLKLRISDLDSPTADHRPRPYTFARGQLTAEPESMHSDEEDERLQHSPPLRRPPIHSLPTSGSQTSLPYLRPDARGHADSPYDQARKAQAQLKLSAPPRARVFTNARIPEPAGTRPRARKMSSGAGEGRMEGFVRNAAPLRGETRPTLGANESEASLALSGETAVESPGEERGDRAGEGKVKEDSEDDSRSESVMDHERSSPLSNLVSVSATAANRLVLELSSSPEVSSSSSSPSSSPTSRRSNSVPIPIPIPASLRPGPSPSPVPVAVTENRKTPASMPGPLLRPPLSSPQRPRFSLAHSSGSGSASSASLASVSSTSRSGSSRAREVGVIPIPEEAEAGGLDVGGSGSFQRTDSDRLEEAGPGLSNREDGASPSLIRALQRIRQPDALALAHLPSPHLPSNPQPRPQPRAESPPIPPPAPRATSPRRSSPHPRAPGTSSGAPLFEPDEWDAFFSDVRSRAAIPRLSQTQIDVPGMNMNMRMGAGVGVRA